MPFSPCITSDEKEAIFALNEAGLTTAQIAEKVGRGVRSINRVLQKGRVTVRGRVRRLEGNDLRRAIQLRRNGMKMAQIAAELDFSLSTVSNALNRASVKCGAPKPQKKSNAAEPLILPRLIVRLSERVQRMRDSFKARGMGHEEATREAMRICAASAVEVRGDSNSRAGGGVGVNASFHVQSMTGEAP
jgi:transposase